MRYVSLSIIKIVFILLIGFGFILSASELSSMQYLIADKGDYPKDG